MKKIFVRFKSKIATMTPVFFYLIFSLQRVFAEDIQSSKIGQGLTKLVQDATSLLLILAPATGACLIIYYLIRKGMADETEHRKWNSRIVVTLISCIGAVVASVLINVLTSYFA